MVFDEKNNEEALLRIQIHHEKHQWTNSCIHKTKHRRFLSYDFDITTISFTESCIVMTCNLW